MAALILGGIGGFSVIACCGLTTWLAWAFIIPTVTKEPEEVLAVHRQIWTSEMLEDFSPDTAINLDNSFMQVRVVNFMHKEGKGELILASSRMKLNSIGPDDTSTKLSSQFRETFELGIRDQIDFTSTETNHITIDGADVTVTVRGGTDKLHKKPLHTAEATFKLGSNKISFLIQMDDDIWDQEAVFKMLENAKSPPNP